MYLSLHDGIIEQVENLPEIKASFPSGICYADNETTLPNGKKQINWTRCDIFPPEEIDTISKAARILERLFDNLYRLDAAKDAFVEFDTELKSLCSNDSFAIATVDRRLRAYLFEWRLFLDHWKKYIDNGAQTVYWSDKKDAEKYIKAYQKLYKDVTTDAYENYPEYVHATAIRNHVAHAEKAINYEDIGLFGNAVYISKEVLLRSMHISKSAQEVIEKQSEKIDLRIVAEKSLKAAEKIMEQLMDFQIDEENAAAAISLLNAHKKIEAAGIVSEWWMISRQDEVHWEPSMTQSVTAYRIKDENGEYLHA